VLVTPEGELRDLWPSKPAELEPDHAWSAADRRWIITGYEQFSDGDPHTSVWSLDSRDRARRLACDAAADRDSGYVTAAVLTDDTAYLVAKYLFASGGDMDDAFGTWKLIRVEQ